MGKLRLADAKLLRRLFWVMPRSLRSRVMMRLNSIAILLPSFTLYQNAARKGRTGFALHCQGAGAERFAGSCSTLGAGTPPPFCFPPCRFALLPAALHPAGLAADKDPKMRRNPQSTPECSLRVRCAVLGRVGILLAETALLCAAFGCGTNVGSTAFYMV